MAPLELERDHHAFAREIFMHRCKKLTFIWLSVVLQLACCRQAVAEESPEVKALRETITRSVPFIERQGAEWISQKSCLSCHHTAFMVWSLNAAKKEGSPVNAEKLAENTAWAMNWRHLVSTPEVDEAKRGDTLVG